MRIPRTGSQLLRPRPDQGFQSVRSDDMLFLSSVWTCEMRLLVEAAIPGIRDTLVLVINGTSVDTVYPFTPQCGPEGPVSVSGCCTDAFYYIDMLKRPGYGSRSRVGLTGRDFKDLRACLRHHTTY